MNKKHGHQSSIAPDGCQGILEGMFDGVSIHDLDFNITHVNQTLATALGLNKEEMVGRKCYEVFHGTSRPIANCPHARALKTGQRANVRLKEPHLGGITIIVSSYPLFDGDGKAIGAVHVVRDVTELELLEDSRNKALEELRRSNADLEQFAHVVSHDLQEPLRSVASYIELIERRYGDSLDEDAGEFFGFVIDGVNRMKDLINGLLAFSRVGTTESTRVPTDFGKALAAALDNLETAIQESGAMITSDPLPTLTADPPQITTLFQNLVGNAIKFRQANVQPRVHITAEKRPPGWVFSIKDNGIGIEPRHLDKIFEIFQRLNARGDFPGTGIGLAICKRIAERHGGRIWAEATPGEGSTFYFMIPETAGSENG